MLISYLFFSYLLTNGKAITSIDKAEVGEDINVTMSDGRLTAVVKDKVVFGD